MAEKPQKYFKEQFDDEEIKLVFRKHPIVMRKGLVISMIAWLIGPIYTLILTYANPENPPSMEFFFASLGISILIGVLLLMPSWISWYFSVYIMSDKRFIQLSRSLFKVAVVDIGLEQIQMINYQIKGVQETLLGYGTIMVQTYVGELTIRDVHHPAKTQKKMVGILRELGIHPAQRPTVSDASSDNHTNEEEAK